MCNLLIFRRWGVFGVLMGAVGDLVCGLRADGLRAVFGGFRGRCRILHPWVVRVYTFGCFDSLQSLILIHCTLVVCRSYKVAVCVFGAFGSVN